MPPMAILVSVSTLIGMPGAVLAYVDPGTTTSLFALIAPLLALFGVFFGFLLWPFRRAFSALFGKKKPNEDAAGPEHEEKPEPEEDSMPNAECRMPNQSEKSNAE